MRIYEETVTRRLKSVKMPLKTKFVNTKTDTILVGLWWVKMLYLNVLTVLYYVLRLLNVHLNVLTISMSIINIHSKDTQSP